jgi:crotonobetainyl-CoA:carnitine CoA-transferase CaiB-like acyl-CoA transferase
VGLLVESEIALLSKLTVLEIGDNIAAPACSSILAGLGARTIKLEPPRVGDSARTIPPFFGDVVDINSSEIFGFLNAGKQSITLDLSKTSSHEFLASLLRHVEIVVDNVTHHARYGGFYTDDWLRQARANLIICHISPFGRTGPRSAWVAHDINIAAASGFSQTMGLPDREPLSLPQATIGLNTGTYAAAAVLAAVLDQSGPAPEIDPDSRTSIDISEEEAMLAVHTASDIVARALGGNELRRQGSVQSSDKFVHENLPCADGMAHVSFVVAEQRHNLLRLLGEAAETDQSSVEHVKAAVESWLAQRSRAAILAAEIANNIGVVPVLDAHQFAAYVNPDPQPTFVPLGDPLTRKPRRGPTLGQHNSRIWQQQIGLSVDLVQQMFATGLI